MIGECLLRGYCSRRSLIESTDTVNFKFSDFQPNQSQHKYYPLFLAELATIKIALQYGLCRYLV